MERIEEFIKFEEDMGVTEPRWARPMEEENKRKRRREFAEKTERRTARAEPTRSAYEGVYTIFKEPIYRLLTHIKDKTYFGRPSKMVGDPGRWNPNLWCSYHREHGHLT